jgi:hypothetical protein
MIRTNQIFLLARLLVFLVGAFTGVGTQNISGQTVTVLRNPHLNPAVTQYKQLPRRPRDLTELEKIHRVQQVLGSGSHPISGLETPITLSPTNFVVPNRAFLELYFPAFVNPTLSGENMAMAFSGGGPGFTRGSLGVTFIAPSAGIYLIYFTTSANTKTNFTLESSDYIKTTSTLDSGSQHPLFVTEAKQAGQKITLGLSGDEFWIFYACEISKTK